MFGRLKDICLLCNQKTVRDNRKPACGDRETKTTKKRKSNSDYI